MKSAMKAYNASLLALLLPPSLTERRTRESRVQCFQLAEHLARHINRSEGGGDGDQHKQFFCIIMNHIH
jgi:hypothetical protein